MAVVEHGGYVETPQWRWCVGHWRWFVGIDGRNDANFCLTDTFNLKGFGSIDQMEGIGEMNEFEEVSTNWCRDDWLHGGLEKQNKNEKICKEISMQSATYLPASDDSEIQYWGLNALVSDAHIAKHGRPKPTAVPEKTPTMGLGKTACRAVLKPQRSQTKANLAKCSKACESRDMSQYLPHILSLSSLEDIFIIFTIEAVVRCWSYWRRNFEFLLHFLTDVIPE